MDLEKEVEDLMEFVLWAFESVQPRETPHSEETRKRLAFVKKAFRQTLELERNRHKKSDSRPNDPPVTIRLGWSPDLATGNTTIDAQHQALFQAGDQLFEAILSNTPKARIEMLMSSLIAKIGQHFQSEEQLLNEMNHTLAAEHAGIHRRLLSKANQLFQSYQKDEIGIGVMLDFVTNDLIQSHIAREDRLFEPGSGQ